MNQYFNKFLKALRTLPHLREARPKVWVRPLRRVRSLQRVRPMQKSLGLQALHWYLLLHTLLCAVLFYLLIQGDAQLDSRLAIAIFFTAKLLIIVLLRGPKLSLRITWAACAIWLVYWLYQTAGDALGSYTQSANHAIAILYHILQSKMALFFALAFLLSSLLALRFAKYRRVEACLLLFLGLFLLTREAQGLEDRYNLYRLLWLGIPSASLLLIIVSLHPLLQGEKSWLAPSFFTQSGQNPKHFTLSKWGKQIASFAALLFLLFLLLWWSRLSPMNWQRPSGGLRPGNGLLEKNLRNQFDFGEYLQLDSSLEQDRQLVMMSQIEDLKDQHPRYLKRFTLSALKNRGSFFRDPKEPYMPGESPLPLELERGTSTLQMPRYDLRKRQDAYMFLLNIKPSSLFVLNYPTKIQTFENWPDSSFSRVYRVEAHTLEKLFPFGLELQDYPSAIPVKPLEYYTRFPSEYSDIAAFTLDLLQQIQPQKSVDQMVQMPALELAQIITSYFHREYRYSLNPGIAPDGDQLRYFLFESKKGYCTYFALSAGLMLRSLGMPTRIAVGFLLNPQLRILDYYPLFADQAHAWIEIFDPKQGWITFDPTTFELAPGEMLEFGLPEGAEEDLAALTEELLRNNILNEEAGLQQIQTQNPTAPFLLQFLQGLKQHNWILPLATLLLMGFILLFLRLRLSYLALKAPIPNIVANGELQNNPDKANETKNHEASSTRMRRFAKIMDSMYRYLQLFDRELFTIVNAITNKSKPEISTIPKFPDQIYAQKEVLAQLDKSLQNDVQDNLAFLKEPTEPNQQKKREPVKTEKRQRDVKDGLSSAIYQSQMALSHLQKYCFGRHFSAEEAAQIRLCLHVITTQKKLQCKTWFAVYRNIFSGIFVKSLKKCLKIL